MAHSSNMIPLSYVSPPDELDEVRKIFLEYQQFLGVDLCFQSFDEELKNLHKVYAQPQGCIILAKTPENEVVGCVALKPIAEGVCEMKRLYVKSTHRGHHLGKNLVQELLHFARTANYHTMKLDTLTSLESAIAIYRKVGFVETTPYVFNPLNDVLYFELNLLSES